MQEWGRGVARAGEQKSVAVGRRVRHLARRDRAAAAPHILDQHALRKLLVETIGKDARVQVDAAAGRDMNNELDRPVGPIALGGALGLGDRDG